MAENAEYKLTDQDLRDFHKTIRPLFREVVSQYRDYKIKHKQLHVANEDSEDLKKMIQDANQMNASKSIEMEYTLRKQEKDIDEIGRTLKNFRQFLAELTTEDAVQKIDNNMLGEYNKAEQIMLYNLIRNASRKVVEAYREYKLAKKPLDKDAREKLIDLVGAEAVDKLDKESQVEQK